MAVLQAIKTFIELAPFGKKNKTPYGIKLSLKNVWDSKPAFEQQFGYPSQKCSSVTISTNAL